ncbi:MAG: PEP-CTERM sorting domain-containing protein [Planctomycetia bacterium]|nr:PEP-CTERM sorting domain-containing protein [Planctomycetia bacterium]
MLFVLGWFFSTSLPAQTTWTGSTDTNLLNAANWSNGLPTATNPGTINTAITGLTNKTVNGFTLTSSANISSASTDPATHWTLQNGGIWNVTAGTLSGLSGQYFRVGEAAADPVSIVNVTGTGRIEMASYFLLGRAGSGELNLCDSAYVKHGSNSFTIGDSGTGKGTVNIYDNATLELNVTTQVGNHTGSEGTINMHGGTLTGSTTIRVGGGDSSTDTRKSTGFFNYTAGKLDIAVAVGCGINATGTFTVKSGSTLDVTKNFYVGYDAQTAGGSLILETGSALNHTAGNFSVGEAGKGTATIAAGTSFSSTVGINVGNQAGSNGTISVAGTLAASSLTVGNAGTGALDITAGGSANITSLRVGSVASGLGTVTVSGENAKLETVGFSVGFSATGTSGTSGIETYGGSLVVGNGGAWVDSSTGSVTVYIGQNAGSTGKVEIAEGGTVDFGSDSSKTLNVGHLGTGLLHYNSTGNHTLGLTIRVGREKSGVGTVDIEKGTVTQTGGRYFIVGHAGKGYLNIHNGGTLDASQLYVGDSKGSGAHGEIQVSDRGKIKTNNFYMADKDTTTALVNINEGGTINATTTKIGYSQHWGDTDPTKQQYGGSATFNLNGGTFTSNTFQIGKTSEVNILSGSFTNSGALSIYGTSELNLEKGTFSTGSISQNDDSVIRFTQGIDFTAGDYAMNGGRLEVAISSALEGGKDAYLEFTGEVQLLNGEIILDFDEVFLETLEMGTSIPILSAETLSDVALSISGNTSIPSAFWSYHIDNGILYADMSVPEPSTLLLLLGGFLGLLGWKQWKRKSNVF